MSLPTCGGAARQFICSLCGRPPGERCAREAPVPIKACPGCDGTGHWPKTTSNPCPHCEGTGEWRT